MKDFKFSDMGLGSDFCSFLRKSHLYLQDHRKPPSLRILAIPGRVWEKRQATTGLIFFFLVLVQSYMRVNNKLDFAANYQQLYFETFTGVSERFHIKQGHG